MRRYVRHGHSRHPLYFVWVDMHRRCDSPTREDYPLYGGRGITVCARWSSFAAFVEDMGPRPTGASIDRIDNERGYSPDNCRWATSTQQGRNRRSTRLEAHEPDQIRFLASQNIRHREIAEFFSISVPTVRAVLYEQNWRG